MTKNDNFSLAIMAENVDFPDPISGYSFDLKYDPNVFQVDFNPVEVGTQLPPDAILLTSYVNDAPGLITVGHSAVGDTGVDVMNGLLLRFSGKVLSVPSPGTYQITFVSPKLFSNIPLPDGTGKVELQTNWEDTTVSLQTGGRIFISIILE